MKTTFDLIDIVWNYLKTSSLKTLINGGIYKYDARPVNSNKQDVTITSLPVSNTQLQEAIVNVNIFVPDLTVSLNGVNTKVPDHVKLKELTDIAVEELDTWTTDYNFSVRQQTVIKDEDSASHFANIRLEFYSINILN